MKALIRYTETIACIVQIETDLTPDQLRAATACGKAQWRVATDDALLADKVTPTRELVMYDLEGVDRL